MDEVIKQMRDIHGPDAVSWWPPALGWWVLAAVILGLIGFALFSWWWRRKRARDWRVDARLRMRKLAKAMRDNDTKASVSELSELLRRVAMARYGRDACAGLAGEEWLAWLTSNDPVGFKWNEHGRVLLDLPYLPPGAGAGSQDLRKLVGAAKRWVTSAPYPEGSAGSSGDDDAAPVASGLRLRVKVATD